LISAVIRQRNDCDLQS